MNIQTVVWFHGGYGVQVPDWHGFMGELWRLSSCTATWLLRLSPWAKALRHPQVWPCASTLYFLSSVRMSVGIGEEENLCVTVHWGCKDSIQIFLSSCHVSRHWKYWVVLVETSVHVCHFRNREVWRTCVLLETMEGISQNFYGFKTHTTFTDTQVSNLSGQFIRHTVRW